MIIKRLVPHISIILGLVTLTLLILVQFNPGIMASNFYLVITYGSCGIAIITSGLLIALQRKE